MKAKLTLLTLLTVLLFAGPAAASNVDDPGFEAGICGVNPYWSCTTDTDCPNWILNAQDAWGIDAYEGEMIAQLGGFCGETANSNSFCQDVFLEGGCLMPYLTWRWLGIVENDGGNYLRIKVDGDVRYEKELTQADDTFPDWQTDYIDIYEDWGEAELCIELEATTGAAILIDSIGSFWSPTPTEAASFSTVKSLY